MKCISAIPAVIVLGLTACDTMNRPLTTSGDFDPLRPPGSNLPSTTQAGPTFKAGQFVRALMDNTAFFKSKPKGEMDADKLLTRGTSMKVISSVESYIKVELDSGEVGYVPSVMVEDPSAASAAPAQVNPGEYQVYPPVGGAVQPLPPATPAGDLPPEGAIPTVIDPEAPGNPLPPTTVTPVPLPPNGTAPQVEPAPLPPETIMPKTGPAPLPPNGEEPKAAEKPVEQLNPAELVKPADVEKPAEQAPKSE